jgi:hypothetical protein
MKRRENNIVIIIPYFGKWPAWFDYFLLSCSYNSSVDWLLFTDCGKPAEIFDNTRFIDFNLDDFNRLASRQTGLNIDIKNPYKLCDLKPAYGHIFTEFIKDYRFWGYGDIDLVYGNLNAYFIAELLNKHDILSNHDQFISGHLCLIRNMPETNLLYRKNGLYEDVFKDPYYTGFDEQLLKRKFKPETEYLPSRMRSHLNQHILKYCLISFVLGIIPSGLKARLKRRNRTIIKDYTSIVRHYAESEGIRVLRLRTFQSDLMLEKLGVKRWIITWDKGRLTSSYNREGLLYFHFIRSKLDKSFSIQDFVPGTDGFIITSKGIKSVGE